MALSLADKKNVVAEVAQVAASAVSVVAAEYRGLTVSDMTRLREQARKSGVYLRVVRNTLARRALEGTDFACMHEVLTGPLFLAFSQTEPSAAARLLRDFTKEHEVVVVKAISLDGKLLAGSELKTVAALPTKEEAISKFLCVLKAPITKFVQTLVEPHAKLVRTFAAVRDQKQAS